MTANRIFTVVLMPQPEGGFAVQVPALPEVNTQGRDRAQALERVTEAIEAAIEQRIADGETIPLTDRAEIIEVSVVAAA